MTFTSPSQHKVYIILLSIILSVNCEESIFRTIKGVFKEISSNLPSTSNLYEKGAQLKETLSGYASELSKRNKYSKRKETIGSLTGELYENVKEHGEKLKETVNIYATEIGKSVEYGKLKETFGILPEYTEQLYENVKVHGQQMKKKVNDYVGEIGKYYESHITKTSSSERKMTMGGFIGASKNAAQYVVQVGGRRTNILNIFDKTSLSARGNSRWSWRIDKPHGSTNFHHINVNKAITGVKDPHIQISAISAHTAGIAGHALSFLNKIAPVATVAAVAYDVYEIGITYMEEKYYGTFEKTRRQVIAVISTYVGGYFGAATGASIGTAIFPGVGTLIGGIAGGVVGGIGRGVGGEVAAEILNYLI